MDFESPKAGKAEALKDLNDLAEILKKLEDIKRLDTDYEKGPIVSIDVNNIFLTPQNTASFMECRMSEFALYGEHLEKALAKVKKSMSLLDESDNALAQTLIMTGNFFMIARNEEVRDLLHRIRLVEFTRSRIGGLPLSDFEKERMLKDGGYRRLTEAEKRMIEPIIAAYNKIDVSDLYYQESPGTLR